MHKSILTIAAATLAITASPALADEAIDVDTMAEQSSPITVNAITPIVRGFDIKNIGSPSATEFMATMSSKYRPGYRFTEPVAKFDNGTSAGLAAIFVPEEFAYRSSAQDTGVDSAVPGRFVPSSTRADYLSETGPATRDKSSLGIRLGF